MKALSIYIRIIKPISFTALSNWWFDTSPRQISSLLGRFFNESSLQVIQLNKEIFYNILKYIT